MCGEGAYVYDAAGKRFMDFACGIGVTATGHCHPRIVSAIQQQATRLVFGQINCMIPAPTLRYAEALRTVMPERLDCFFFSNSGAEAVEGAIKLAKMATGRTNVIAFTGGFHGRTAMTMALTSSKGVFRAGYQPLPAGVSFAPYPYAFRFGWDEEQTVQFCLSELERLLRGQTLPSETAAVLIEPVLGEGVMLKENGQQNSEREDRLAAKHSDDVTRIRIVTLETHISANIGGHRSGQRGITCSSRLNLSNHPVDLAQPAQLDTWRILRLAKMHVYTDCRIDILGHSRCALGRLDSAGMFGRS